MTIIKTASVKVMRSYDYCHFETYLTVWDNTCSGLTPSLERKAIWSRSGPGNSKRGLSGLFLNFKIMSKTNAERILITKMIVASGGDYNDVEDELQRLVNDPAHKLVLEAMEEYAAQQVKEFKEMLKIAINNHEDVMIHQGRIVIDLMDKL